MSSPNLRALLLGNLVLLFCSSIDAKSRAESRGDPEDFGITQQASYLNLVQSEQILQHLKLTSRQVQQLKEIDWNDSKASLAAGEVERKVKKSLEPRQWERLKQIHWQLLGGYALFESELQKKLELTKNQLRALTIIAEENRQLYREMEEQMMRIRFRSPDQCEEFVEGYRMEAQERLLNVLTDSQAKLFKETLGAAIPEQLKQELQRDR